METVINIFGFDPEAEELDAEEVLGNIEPLAGIHQESEDALHIVEPPQLVATSRHPNREPAVRTSGSKKRKSARKKRDQDADKRIRGADWNREETLTLVELREEGKPFDAIAQQLQGRDARQCEYKVYSLRSQFRKIKKHDAESGGGPQGRTSTYAEMNVSARRNADLPDRFDPKLFQIMERLTTRPLQKSELDGHSESCILCKCRSEGGIQLPPSSTSNLNTATEGLSSIGTSYTAAQEGEVSLGRKLSVSDTGLVMRAKMIKLLEEKLEAEKDIFRLEKILHERDSREGSKHNVGVADA